MKKTIITLIRAAVGWHFLYEGLIKLFADNWSAASYLNNTFSFLSGFYHWLAASPARLAVVDFLNVWGLILIGLALFVGLFARWASLAGAFLLLLYYFAYPPFGFSLLGGDGAVYIINPLLIETLVLAFFFCFKEMGYGLDNLLPLLKKGKAFEATAGMPLVHKGMDETAVGNATAGMPLLQRGMDEPVSDMNEQGKASPDDTMTEGPQLNSRREALKELVTLPVLGLFGWGAWQRSKTYGVDTLSGATIQINRMELSELKGEMPKGKIKNLEISRMIMGGNQIVGYAHSRDLQYVSKLYKAYNTDKKVFETIMLGEQAGMNCINTSFIAMPTIVKYKKLTGSKINVIMQAAVNENADDIYENVAVGVDNGINIIQLHGGVCDRLVQENKFDLIEGIVDRIRSNGVIAGICAHSVNSLLACEEKGITPDYFMKTMHHDNYWSAHPRENRTPFETNGENFRDHNMFHDNMWDAFPEITVDLVNRTKVPVIGFKTLAAGAISPRNSFKWAFENGADFICVGMFDFQVVEDVNICIDVLNNLNNRKRQWYG